MSPDRFVLTLPSSPEHLGTARSFAAAVARHYDVAGETVEDLKIAVSEACVDALVAGAPIEVLVEEAPSVEPAVSFSVRAPETAGAPDRAELGAPARIELIRSLFPDATVSSDDSRRAIRFTLPLG